ncbi:MAG: hypothetical protein ACR2QA_12365 [Solirubrobacteraceae bacterium]
MTHPANTKRCAATGEGSGRGHGGSATRVAVLDVEELHQEWSHDDVLPEDPRLDLAVG